MIQFDNKKCLRAGRWQIQPGPESFAFFVPFPLPPSPGLDSEALQGSLEKASRALGRLDGITTLLPDPDLFVYSYVRKEAVLSSQIEGTQSSLSDLLASENGAVPGVPVNAAQEVSNYVAALNHGLERLATLPVSLRLIREMHALLMKGTRGGEKTPGEFRMSQNWVNGSRPGNASYVPPPHHELGPCLGALEKFIHKENFPTLIKAGLAHAQFESVHPFLDGNGRLGRILITFILCAEKALTRPRL